MITSSLFVWLPKGQRKPMLHRLLIVWAMSLPIALATWMAQRSDGLTHDFGVSLVYSYAISTFIWLLIDVSRFRFMRLLRAQSPFYWPPPLTASLMLVVGIPLGFVLGTLVGDAYAGVSTWALWHVNPNRFAGMALTSVAISAAFATFFYLRGKAESLAHQASQSKLMLLQSQLEPHMLFNTLAHLRALIGQDSARALTMLDHLNDFLRTTLNASRQPQHRLDVEFSRLHDYLSLMSNRMGPRLVFQLDLPSELAAAHVPTFILQPLVENAIHHGLDPTVAGGRIAVQARSLGSQLLLTVRDDGCGISELALADSARPLTSSNDHATASWGLAHVRQHLHTLYGERAGMHISPVTTGGTCVVLSLPLKKSTTA